MGSQFKGAVPHGTEGTAVEREVAGHIAFRVRKQRGMVLKWRSLLHSGWDSRPRGGDTHI